MEPEKINSKKKKFNRPLYLVCLLFSLIIGYLGLSTPIKNSEIAGMGRDEMTGYIIGSFVGQIMVIIIISYVLYFIINGGRNYIIKRIK